MEHGWGPWMVTFPLFCLCHSPSVPPPIFNFFLPLSHGFLLNKTHAIDFGKMVWFAPNSGRGIPNNFNTWIPTTLITGS